MFILLNIIYNPETLIVLLHRPHTILDLMRHVATVYCKELQCDGTH
jgi:hypothetical protein